MDADDDPPGLFGRLDEGAGLHCYLGVEGAEHTGLRLAVGLLDTLGQIRGAQVAGRQDQWIELDPQLTPGAADQFGFGHLEDGLDRVVHLGCQATQGE